MRDEEPIFGIEVETLDDRAHVVVTLVGEVDSNNVSEIDAVTAVVARWSETMQVVADLRAVTFLDSSGVAALLRCRQACDNRGLDFTIVEPQGMPLTVLRITGVLEYLSGPTANVGPPDAQAV